VFTVGREYIGPNIDKRGSRPPKLRILSVFRPLINGKAGIELVWLWLAKYNMDSYISEVTAENPRAICYVDDKAIRFLNWEQSLKDIALHTNESI
jgi:hypothetical protein